MSIQPGASTSPRPSSSSVPVSVDLADARRCGRRRPRRRPRSRARRCRRSRSRRARRDRAVTRSASARQLVRGEELPDHVAGLDLLRREPERRDRDRARPGVAAAVDDVEDGRAVRPCSPVQVRRRTWLPRRVSVNFASQWSCAAQFAIDGGCDGSTAPPQQCTAPPLNGTTGSAVPEKRCDRDRRGLPLRPAVDDHARPARTRRTCSGAVHASTDVIAPPSDMPVE